MRKDTRISKEAAWEKTASWDDVRAKGQAIFDNGGVEIYRDDAQEVGAYVMSGVVDGMYPVTDGGPYETILSKKSWESSGNVGGWVQAFLCECKWGQYHSGSPGHGGRWAGRFCFEPDSMVLMADGSFKPISEIQVGDMVQSKDMPRRVLNVFENDYDGEMVELGFTGSCFPVRMTADHNVLCNDALDKWLDGHSAKGLSNNRSVGYRLLHDVRQWDGFKQCGDFERGDLVLFGAINDVVDTESIDFVDEFGDSIYEDDGSVYWVWGKPDDCNGGRWRTLSPVNRSIPFDDDFAYVLGWYLAEGSVDGHINKQSGEKANSIIRWTLNQEERDVAERIISILESWGCEGASIYDYSYRGAIAVKVSSRPLAELFIRLCGEGSKGKALESRVMLAQPTWQSAFLDAYYSGDGTIKGNCRCIYTSNPYLARQVNQIVQRVYGVDASVHKNANTLGPTYRSSAYSREERESSGLTIYHIDFDGDYVQRRYAVDDFHTAHKVNSIRRYYKNGKVWNIEVEGEHMYCVDGLLVHNCSHSYAVLLAANMRARGEFMNDRTASVDWHRVEFDGEMIHEREYANGCIGRIFKRKYWELTSSDGNVVDEGRESNLAECKESCDYYASMRTAGLRINKDNFYEGTRAVWYECNAPSREPDFVSDSGSMYWHYPEGVVRGADHWGCDIGDCDWRIAGDADHISAWFDNCGERYAFCPWQMFEPNVPETDGDWREESISIGDGQPLVECFKDVGDFKLRVHVDYTDVTGRVYKIILDDDVLFEGNCGDEEDGMAFIDEFYKDIVKTAGEENVDWFRGADGEPVYVGDTVTDGDWDFELVRINDHDGVVSLTLRDDGGYEFDTYDDDVYEVDVSKVKEAVLGRKTAWHGGFDDGVYENDYMDGWTGEAYDTGEWTLYQHGEMMDWGVEGDLTAAQAACDAMHEEEFMGQLSIRGSKIASDWKRYDLQFGVDYECEYPGGYTGLISVMDMGAGGARWNLERWNSDGTSDTVSQGKIPAGSLEDVSEQAQVACDEAMADIYEFEWRPASRKVAGWTYGDYDEDTTWRCYEPGFEGEYDLDDMKELYESDVDKSEYPEFSDWEWDMVRSGFMSKTAALGGVWVENGVDGRYRDYGLDLSGMVLLTHDGDINCWWGLYRGYSGSIAEGTCDSLEDGMALCDAAAQDELDSTFEGFASRASRKEAGAWNVQDNGSWASKKYPDPNGYGDDHYGYADEGGYWSITTNGGMVLVEDDSCHSIDDAMAMCDEHAYFSGYIASRASRKEAGIQPHVCSGGERELLEAVAASLESKSGKCEFRVEDVHFDYGQDWMWTTIVAHKDGDSWQVLDPREFEHILAGADPDVVADVILGGDYGYLYASSKTALRDCIDWNREEFDEYDDYQWWYGTAENGKECAVGIDWNSYDLELECYYDGMLISTVPSRFDSDGIELQNLDEAKEQVNVYAFEDIEGVHFERDYWGRPIVGGRGSRKTASIPNYNLMTDIHKGWSNFGTPYDEPEGFIDYMFDKGYIDAFEEDTLLGICRDWFSRYGSDDTEEFIHYLCVGESIGGSRKTAGPFWNSDNVLADALIGDYYCALLDHGDSVAVAFEGIDEPWVTGLYDVSDFTNHVGDLYTDYGAGIKVDGEDVRKIRLWVKDTMHEVGRATYAFRKEAGWELVDQVDDFWNNDYGWGQGFARKSYSGDGYEWSLYDHSGTYCVAVGDAGNLEEAQGACDVRAIEHANSHGYDMMASRKWSGRRLEFEDDIVIVRNPNGGVDYKGIFDYCPYKDDFDNGDWRFNGTLYEDQDHPGYTLEIVSGRMSKSADYITDHDGWVDEGYEIDDMGHMFSRYVCTDFAPSLAYIDVHDAPMSGHQCIWEVWFEGMRGETRTFDSAEDAIEYAEGVIEDNFDELIDASFASRKQAARHTLYFTERGGTQVAEFDDAVISETAGEFSDVNLFGVSYDFEDGEAEDMGIVDGVTGDVDPWALLDFIKDELIPMLEMTYESRKGASKAAGDEIQVGDLVDYFYDDFYNGQLDVYHGTYEVVDIDGMSWRDSDGGYNDQRKYTLKNIDTGETFKVTNGMGKTIERHASRKAAEVQLLDMDNSNGYYHSRLKDESGDWLDLYVSEGGAGWDWTLSNELDPSGVIGGSEEGFATAQDAIDDFNDWCDLNVNGARTAAQIGEQFWDPDNQMMHEIVDVEYGADPYLDPDEDYDIDTYLVVDENGDTWYATDTDLDAFEKWGGRKVAQDLEDIAIGDMFNYDLSGDPDKYWEVVDVDYGSGLCLVQSHSGEEEWWEIEELLADLEYENMFRVGGKTAAKKSATRQFTYAEQKELEDEIEGTELHNADRFKDGGAAYYGSL